MSFSSSIVLKEYTNTIVLARSITNIPIQSEHISADTTTHSSATHPLSHNTLPKYEQLPHLLMLHVFSSSFINQSSGPLYAAITVAIGPSRKYFSSSKYVT